MKKAIILASFGVINEKVREKTIDALANEITEKFPDFKVVQAFTSKFIIKKLNEIGIKILTIEEQIKNLSKEFEKIIIMPTHLTAGEEFENKIKIYESENIKVISPIFDIYDKNFIYERILDIILKEYPINEENLILIGHGSPHRHNEFYEKFQDFIDEKYKNIHVGVIEKNDTPNFENVMERLKKISVKKILLIPLLFNGGSHVEKDIKNFWQTELEKSGYEVSVYVDGLGTLKEFRQLYIEKIKANLCIEKNQEKLFFV